nr:MAG TPA: hypothetical protein [Caudoviricetes sp.]
MLLIIEHRSLSSGCTSLNVYPSNSFVSPSGVHRADKLVERNIWKQQKHRETSSRTT